MLVQEFAHEFPNIIVDLTSIGITAVDTRMNIILWNRFMEFHTHLKPSDVLGKNIFDCFPELPKEWLEKKIKSLIVLKNMAFTSWQQRPYLFKFPNTRSITAFIPFMYQDCSLWAIQDKNGMVKGVCISVHDMTDTANAQLLLQEATEQAVQMQETSQRDCLTGLYNRSYFSDQISNEVSRARRYERPLSLLLIDIDFFKKINDTHGHLAGDEVIRIVAFKLLKTLRDSDILARYGGEEFALILPHLNMKESAAVAERLRGIIEKDPIVFEEKELKVTVSIGISEITEGITTDQLMKEADSALYISKREGRNRVTCFSATQRTPFNPSP